MARPYIDVLQDLKLMILEYLGKNLVQDLTRFFKMQDLG